MGRAINKMVSEIDDATIVAGVDVSDNKEGLDFPVFKNINDFDGDFDCIIDFSNVSVVCDVLNYAVAKKKPAVICTTGLGDKELSALNEASKVVPVFKSANMSLGMNVLIAVCKKVSDFLYLAISESARSGQLCVIQHFQSFELWLPILPPPLQILHQPFLWLQSLSHPRSRHYYQVYNQIYMRHT